MPNTMGHSYFGPAVGGDYLQGLQAGPLTPSRNLQKHATTVTAMPLPSFQGQMTLPYDLRMQMSQVQDPVL